MLAIDDEGYLVDPERWNEDWAGQTAAALSLDLEDDHWFVIRFIRHWYSEHQTAPDARHALRHIEQRFPAAGSQPRPAESASDVAGAGPRLL